ncbi:hypothetical protein NIES3974_45570 [Calothrix sp. NIES-3974]|nr:hypothetical protein NIES3974_45570 [Calothrix sp. NIES-3974]
MILFASYLSAFAGYHMANGQTSNERMKLGSIVRSFGATLEMILLFSLFDPN